MHACQNREGDALATSKQPARSNTVIALEHIVGLDFNCSIYDSQRNARAAKTELDLIMKELSDRMLYFF
jgi:hypothetical protein